MKFNKNTGEIYFCSGLPEKRFSIYKYNIMIVYIYIHIYIHKFVFIFAELSFNICKKNDPNLDKCLKTSLQSVIPDLGEGYPKLRIPAIEPFELPSLEIDHGKGSSKAVSIDLKLKDVKIMGLTSTMLDSLKIDVDNHKLSGQISFGKPLEITGQYTVNGKVLVLPITGNGPCKIVLRKYII